MESGSNSTDREVMYARRNQLIGAMGGGFALLGLCAGAIECGNNQDQDARGETWAAQEYGVAWAGCDSQFDAVRDVCDKSMDAGLCSAMAEMRKCMMERGVSFERLPVLKTAHQGDGTADECFIKVEPFVTRQTGTGLSETCDWSKYDGSSLDVSR